MSILVFDKNPELFWYVSGVLRETNIALKHLTSVDDGEEAILRDLPKLVILNAGSELDSVSEIIFKMRNHVFARDTIFIVFTTAVDPQLRRSYLVAGSGYIVHHAKGSFPQPAFFLTVIKWLLNYKKSNEEFFEFTPTEFPAEVDWTGFGRVGWVSENYILLEANLALEPGEIIDIKSSIFEDIGLRKMSVECIEKNTIGRYYQYANTLLCKINFENSLTDKANLMSWLKANKQLSKSKSIKVLFFESDPKYRETIRQMIKLDKQYCARGYSSLENFAAVLDYQLPELILVDRVLIEEEPEEFEAIRKFLANHACYCVTYDATKKVSMKNYKKKYEFALHTKDPVNLPLLEEMIRLLGKKKNATHEIYDSELKLYCSKTSAYSRFTFHTKCQLTEMSENCVGIVFPYQMSKFCGFELSSKTFAVADLTQSQFFRVLFSKKATTRFSGIYHRCIFLGHSKKETDSIKKHLKLILDMSFPAWLTHGKQ